MPGPAPSWPDNAPAANPAAIAGTRCQARQQSGANRAQQGGSYCALRRPCPAASLLATVAARDDRRLCFTCMECSPLSAGIDTHCQSTLPRLRALHGILRRTAAAGTPALLLRVGPKLAEEGIQPPCQAVQALRQARLLLLVGRHTRCDLAHKRLNCRLRGRKDGRQQRMVTWTQQEKKKRKKQLDTAPIARMATPTHTNPDSTPSPSHLHAS